MIVPAGARWRLWIGAEVAPTAAAIALAHEAYIRRAPARCGLESGGRMIVEKPTFIRVDATIDRAAARNPDRAALVYESRRWTYGELRAERDRRAGVLVELGLRPGASVATDDLVTDEMVITWLACARAGMALLILSPLLADRERDGLVARARPALALLSTTPGREPLSASIVAPLGLPGEPGEVALATAAARAAADAGDRPVLLRGTTGTTGGLPKLVVAPHRQCTWRITLARSWWETPDGVYCRASEHHFSPPDICQVFGMGARLFLTRTMQPAHLEAKLVAEEATALWIVPALLHALVQNPRPVPEGLRLTHIRTGAAPLPAVVRRAAEERYGVPIVNSYSTTEGNILMTSPPGTPGGSIGRPLPLVEARLIDEAGEPVPEGEIGEFIVRSPGLMLGYLDDPDATACVIRDGWLHTGDLAHRDADGCYFLVGRRALAINVGGYKVFPDEVEAALVGHPGVREVVVVGAPDAARGEVVRAIIVPGDPAPTVAELQRHCRDLLAVYKVPRQIEFRDSLPRSPLGKVLRHRL
jgi:acyl-CoA synthetase (AMP-forming)/AMP-acid ligase II